MKDSDGFKATFAVPGGKKFVPWVEIYFKGDVEVSGVASREIFHSTVKDTPVSAGKEVHSLSWSSSSSDVTIESGKISSASKKIVSVVDSENSLSAKTEWKLKVIEQDGMWVCFGLIQKEFLSEVKDKYDVSHYG